MQIVFAGSPPFATPILRALIDSKHRVAGLITPPDRPKGRGQRIAASPLAALCESRGIPVIRTEDANDPTVLDRITAMQPQAIVVASFGQLLGDRFLALAPLGALNVHASLLPRHRGAAPVAAAIAAGDAETGVTIQRIVKRLDAGPVCASARTPIGPRETAGELTARLAELGAARIVRALEDVEAGRARFEPQDEAAATRAPKLTKASGVIDWSRSAAEIERFIRAMHPWPGASSTLVSGAARARVRFLVARTKDSVAHEARPGTILAASSGAAGEFAIAATSGVLLIEELQLEGGRPMSASEFLRGRRLAQGAHFTS